MSTMTNPNVAKWRSNHHKALETLATNGKPGLTLWRELRRVEQAMARAAVDLCNGVTTQAQFDGAKANAQIKVAKIFGELPVGFFVNSDPRGYALKLKAEYTPKGMMRDWGNYGILAAEIN